MFAIYAPLTQLAIQIPMTWTLNTFTSSTKRYPHGARRSRLFRDGYTEQIHV